MCRRKINCNDIPKTDLTHEEEAEIQRFMQRLEREGYYKPSLSHGQIIKSKRKKTKRQSKKSKRKSKKSKRKSKKSKRKSKRK